MRDYAVDACARNEVLRRMLNTPTPQNLISERKVTERKSPVSD